MISAVFSVVMAVEPSCTLFGRGEARKFSSFGGAKMKAAESQPSSSVAGWRNWQSAGQLAAVGAAGVEAPQRKYENALARNSSLQRMCQPAKTDASGPKLA